MIDSFVRDSDIIRLRGGIDFGITSDDCMHVYLTNILKQTIDLH